MRGDEASQDKRVDTSSKAGGTCIPDVFETKVV